MIDRREQLGESRGTLSLNVEPPFLSSYTQIMREVNEAETGSGACQMQHCVLMIALKISFHSGGLKFDYQFLLQA